MRKILFLPVDLYAAGMVGYLLLRTVNARIYIWPVEIISAYLHLLLLPAIPLLVLSLFLKSRHSAALLGIGAAAYILFFGSLFLPGFKNLDQPIDLTLMTYNTGNGQAPWNELEKAIRESGADIVAIQESVAEEVPLYQRDLSDIYPYQVFYGSGLEGIGMLSRYPIREEGLTYLTGPRPYLVVDLEIGNRTLTVISFHPPVIFGPGAAQAVGRADYAMMADLAVKRGNSILAGDLNLSDQNEGYAAIMTRELTDAHRESGLGLGLTYPRRFNSKLAFPVIRIDYILTTAELEPIETWVGEDGGSDHLPVLARIVWIREG
ncbi:MAG: endonuclease/exonuclease/phosphatase family protein [Anaerolineales bacterium]